LPDWRPGGLEVGSLLPLRTCDSLQPTVVIVVVRLPFLLVSSFIIIVVVESFLLSLF
jgi:hypothetical protein